jgi:Alpha/beta hydrolase domain
VRLDLGEDTHGIQTIIPAKIGTPYPVFVPQLDDDGNEIAGIRMPELAVPLATHTGWNLRSPSIGAPTDLIQLGGGYRPFPRTAVDRERVNDPRRAIEERYPSRQHYLGLVAETSQAMVEQHLLMPEDVVHVLSSAKLHWEFLMEKGGK